MDDFSILLSAKLNEKQSEDDILGKINRIKEKIGDINIKINIDDKNVKIIQDLTKTLNNMNEMSKRQFDVLKETETVTKKADGSIKQVNVQLLRNGEVHEKTKHVIDETTKSLKDQGDVVRYIIKDREKLAEITKKQSVLDENLKPTGKKDTYFEPQEGIVLKRREQQGKPTSYVETIDYKQMEKAEQQLESFQNKYRTLLSTLQQGKNAKFVDEHAVKYLQDYVKNLDTLDQKTKEYIQTQYNVIKNNAKNQSDYYDSWAKEQGRLAKLKEQEVDLEQKAQKEIRDALIKTERTRREEYKKSERAQANAVNKNKDSEYKERQKEIAQRQKLEKDYEQWWIKSLKERDILEQNRIAKLGTQVGVYKELKGEQATQEQLSKTLSGIYKNQQVTITDLNTVTGKYTALIRENGKENKILKGTLDATTGTLYKTSEGTKEVATATKGFMEQLKIALVRVPVWMMAMTAFWGSLRSFQSGLRYVYEIDTELTNLKKVADGTTQTFREFTLEANKMAHQLGSTTKEIIISATEFARLGYNLQQAKILAQEAILYANVGDMDAETASQNLISTIKGFGIAVDEQGKNIRKVVDIFNEVGKKLLPPILVII